MSLEFEGDDEKAATNLRLHGVSFEWAKGVFNDPFAIERLDDRFAYGEARLIIVGLVGGHILHVVYTEREDRIRLISARRATKNEQDDYYRQNS